MTCEEVEQGLTAYHFGTVTDDERARVETHLLVCRACLQAFLDTKRAIETAEGVPAPSEIGRHRLRRAVAAELRLGEAHWSWWQRPVAFALSGAAVMGAMFTTNVLSARPGEAPYEMRGLVTTAAPSTPP